MIGADAFRELCARFEELERGHSVALLGDSAPPPGLKGAGPWIGIHTSGTTGRPNRVWWPWTAFKECIATSASRTGWVWATGFRPDSYAGAQVAAQAWLERGMVHFLTEVGRETWTLLQRELVDALSASPTFVDLLMASDGDDGRWCPRRLIFGGEVLRPLVGRRLRARFLGARIHAVYASSEFGVIFKTRRLDGLYELAGLDRRFEGWRLTENEKPTSDGRGALELRMDGEWRRTGDLAEVGVEPSGEICIRLVGRCDSVANVGGTKVSLDWVVSVTESVPGVVRAMAWAEKNGVTGELVGMRVELEPGLNWTDLKHSVEGHLRANVPRHGWPRVWEVGMIGLGENGKMAKGKGLMADG